MRITRDQVICGYPALEVRALLQRASQQPWGFGCALVQDAWHVSAPTARALLQALQAEGYVEPVTVKAPDHEQWRTTLTGNALANASAASPIARATADRVVTELLARAEQVNANPDYAYYVERLTLFGSYLGTAPTVGDVDVAVYLTLRHTDQELQRQLEDQRIDAACAAGRYFSTSIDQIIWPWYEVVLFLKHRSRTLSLHEERQERPLLARIPTKVIYERAQVHPRDAGTARI